VAWQAPVSNWGSFVNAAEDEAEVITLGFLLNQAMTFCICGQLPGLEIIYSYHPQTMVRAWIGFIGGFLLALVVVVALRSKFGDNHRVGSILTRTLALGLGWSIYRAAKWASADLIKGKHPIMGVAGAFVVSALSVTLMIFLDKILDYTLGRNGNPSMRRMFSHFNDPVDGMPLSERCMRIVMGVMGMLMALAWEIAINFSVETVVVQSEFLYKHQVTSTALISILIGVVMIFPWRRIVLPISEMSERHLEESIKHELLQMDRAEGFMPVRTA
jgi:uncharacterized membrane protein